MTDQNQTEDAALSAANYTPPAQVATNTDINALIADAVQQALAQHTAAQAQQAAANAPKVLSPEEQARVHLDNRGAGLGVEERLQQLYHLVELLAQKVGI